MTDYRHLCDRPTDFKHLASKDPEFAKYFQNERLDFSDPAAFKQLTKSLLRQNFNLDVELPDDRLCPPVPNRLNYILWLQDLIDSSSESLKETYEPGRQVVGLDIGTGSSCVYPLLGCRIRENWRFIATDIDGKNLQYARENVRRNGLEDRIKIYESTSEGPLVPLDVLGIERIDFVMTNPPFYRSSASMLESAQAKSRPPLSACTGAEVEMVVEGGEVAFVRRIIEESLKLGEGVQWYSSMLGNLESVRELVEILNQNGLSKIDESHRGTANWAVKEFVQGYKTRRWGLAWSWERRRPSMSAGRGTRSLEKHLLPFPVLFSFETAQSARAVDVGTHMDELMKSLDLQWQYKPNLLTGVAFIEKNVWSRAARRSRNVEMQVDSHEDLETEEDHEPALIVKISVKSEEFPPSATSVDLRWLTGRDSVLFESFCGMVKREVTKPKH